MVFEKGYLIDQREMANTFHAIVLFLHPLKASESSFQGYRNRPVA